MGEKLKKTIETQFSAGIQSELSPKLVDLVWQSDADLFHFFYEGDKSIFSKLFTAEWPLPVGFFSHRNMTIATQNNRPVGLLNCFAGRRMGEIYQAHVQLITTVLDENASARLVRGLVAMGWLFPFVPSDALYVFNLVVSQKRAGLDANLMAMAEEKAKSEGLKSIHFDIATTAKANTFFRHLGYQPLVETRLCQLREGESVPSHYRIVKILI